MSDEATAFAEIAAWREWFITAHRQRLSHVHEFGDADNPRIVAEELATVVAVADARAEELRAQYLRCHSTAVESKSLASRLRRVARR